MVGVFWHGARREPYLTCALPIWKMGLFAMVIVLATHSAGIANLLPVAVALFVAVMRKLLRSAAQRLHAIR